MAKTIFITGATSGFGWSIAEKFASAGHKLIIAGRRTERLDALKATLKAPTHAITLDVRDRAAVENAFTTLPAEFADIDILVNNAGLARGAKGAPDIAMEDWEVMVDTNIKGLMYCTQSALPGMLARGAGHIINIGSTAAHYPYVGGNAYGGTKAFVAQFSKNLRTDLLGKNIRVSCIEPGMAETEFALVRFNGNATQAKEVYKGVQPLSAEDVAEAVYWSATLPAHVNINHIELMCTNQAAGGLAVHRE